MSLAADPFLATLALVGAVIIISARETEGDKVTHQEAVLESIHDLGLELQVIFNKGAVMVLPSGPRMRWMALAQSSMRRYCRSRSRWAASRPRRYACRCCPPHRPPCALPWRTRPKLLLS